MTQQILVFSAEGHRLDTWGGRGEGPGEFSLAAALVGLPGDSVAVPDLIMRRTPILDSEGAVATTFRNDLRLDPRGEGMVPAQSCCIPLGGVSSNLLVWRYPRVWPREGTGRREVVTTVVRVSRTSTDTVGTLPAGHADDWPDGTASMVSERLGPSIGATIVNGGLLVIGSGQTYGFDVVDVRSGALLRRVRALKPRQPVTAELLRRLESWEASRRAGTSADRLRELARRPVADSVAAFASLQATMSGEVWLGKYLVTPDERSIYQVFSAEGAWLGAVELPGNGVILHMDDSYLIRGTSGAFDESLIEVWSIGPVR